jgi:uncharacterized membrane protein YcaP (DUF421 family)
MFDMAMPWWEFIARAVIVYVALMLMVRLSGKRTVGQFTPFDLLVVMLLSEGVSNSLSGEDNSVIGGLIVAFTLVLLNVIVAVASARSKKVEAVVEGNPILIARDGRIFHDELKRQHVGAGDMDKALREADCDLDNVKCAFLETDGSISVLKRN